MLVKNFDAFTKIINRMLRSNSIDIITSVYCVAMFSMLTASPVNTNTSFVF